MVIYGRPRGHRPIMRGLRAWLSGRASPCQGEGRQFESGRPLEAKVQVTGHSLGHQRVTQGPLDPVLATFWPHH
jgi:hypothetical protein